MNTIENSYGTPLSPDQQVDATEYFSWPQLKDMLIRAAINRQENGGGRDYWSGHVEVSTNTELLTVTATVHIWRVEPPADGDV